jgi:hypothetical protein
MWARIVVSGLDYYTKIPVGSQCKLIVRARVSSFEIAIANSGIANSTFVSTVVFTKLKHSCFFF